MATPPVTAFAETAALYAVLNDDMEEAERIIADMFPSERADFDRQLDRLRALMVDRFGNDLRPILTQPRRDVSDVLGVLFGSDSHRTA